MKILFVILYHKNPNQLIRLVNRLSGEDSHIIIHISKGVPKEEVEIVRNELKHTQNLLFCRRERSEWGYFKLTKAILNAISLAFDEKIEFEYFFLLSAQDYPIKSRNQIVSYLKEHKKKEFLTNFSVEETKSGEAYVDPIRHRKSHRNQAHRYEHYNIRLWKNRYLHFPGELEPNVVGLKGKTKNFLKNVFKFARRKKFPPSLTPYFGSTWFTITRECTQYILDFVENNQSFYRFMKHSFCTDEMFFQTIIMNSSFKERVINDNLRMILWGHEITNHPILLTTENFEQIMNSDGLFARKFDENVDQSVMDLIDKKILQWNNSLTEYK